MWIKYTKFQAIRSANIILSYAYGSRIKFKSRNTGEFEFAISISPSKRWILHPFGSSVVRTRWNQFTFTVDDNIGVCAFINGVKNACQTTYQSISLALHPNKAVRIGGAWYANSEPDIYIDDLAIWKLLLTEDEIKSLYDHAKG